MNNKNMRKIKKTDLSITALLLIGILIVLNFFSYQVFYRLDLTQGKVFSISKASRQAVSELDDIVNIKAYFSENLPSQFMSLRQEVKDILDEYATFSGGKIRVEFIDPSGDDALQRDLMMMGIPQLTFEVYEKDKMQLVNGYMGLAVSFGSNIEAIPAVKSNTSDLEYQLTTAIKKVTSDEIAVIGILNSQGTADLEVGIKNAIAEIAKLYSVIPVPLAEEDPKVPESVDTLVIVGAKEIFSEEQFKAINSFMLRGGALLVLFDGVNVGQGLMAAKNTSNLDELIKKYGVTINKDLVADRRNGTASFTQGFFTFSSPYPYWPKFGGEGFNREHNAVSNLDNVILPWASSLTIDREKIKDDDYRVLAYTSNRAWRATDNFDITPNAANVVLGAEQQFIVAVAVDGEMPNAYPGDAEEGNEKFSGKLIVLGDSDFIYDNFAANTPENLVLFHNLVDTLSFDDDLIKIRSKGVSSRPIKELSDSARVSLRYLNIFGVTIGVIIFGMARYYLRRRSRFVDDL